MEDIKTSPKSLRSLVGEINKGKYNFDLPIQRRAGIWKPKEKSLFIDTLLRNYPIYPALVNKHSDTKEIDVVDFKQRFTTIAAFANDEFKLSKNLKPLTIDGTEYEIAGKKFSKLDETVQSRFNDRDISIITMTDATEEEIVDIQTDRKEALLKAMKLEKLFTLLLIIHSLKKFYLLPSLKRTLTEILLFNV